MRSIVKVTRRRQTTIPVELREKLGIREGDKLMVEATPRGVLFKVIPKLVEAAGLYAKSGTIEEVKRMVDELREE